MSRNVELGQLDQFNMAENQDLLQLKNPSASSDDESGSSVNEGTQLVEVKDFVDNRARTQVFLMSVSFFLVFLAFSGAQNFQTSRDGNVGAISLGLLYASYTFFSFIASYVVVKLGCKMSLIIGGLSYTAFVAANTYYKDFIIYPVSIINGIGASVIWTAEGAYVTTCSQYHEIVNELPEQSTLGSFNGTFWAIFQMNQFLGNLLLAVLFQFEIELWLIFTISTVISLLGTLLFFSLSNMKTADAYEKTRDRMKSAKKNEEISLVAKKDVIPPAPSVFDTIKLWANPGLQVLIPVTIYTGFSQGFMFGEFPALIEPENVKFYTMAVFGLCDTLSSIYLGKMSDRYGRLPPLALGFFAGIILYTVILLRNLGVDFFSFESDQMMYWVPLAVLMGIADGAYNTQLYSLYGTLFEFSPTPGFANLKLFQSGATAIAFLYRDSLNFFGRLVMVFSWMVVGTAMLFLSKRIRDAASIKTLRAHKAV